MVEKVGGWDFCRLELDLDSALLMHFLYKDDEKQNTRRRGNRKMTKRWAVGNVLKNLRPTSIAFVTWRGGKSETSEEKWFKFRRKYRQFERCIVKSFLMLIWQLYGRKTIFQHLTFARKFEDWRLTRILSHTLISFKTTTSTNYATWWNRIETCLTSLPSLRHVSNLSTRICNISRKIIWRGRRNKDVRESKMPHGIGQDEKLTEGMSCRSSCRSKR